MSVSKASSPTATRRSILVDSSRRKSDRAHTGPDEFSSSSRPRVHSLTSRMRSAYSRKAGARSALGCCLVVVSLLLLLAVLLFPQSRRARHRFPCWAPPCRDFVSALAASINASRDPCQDFHSYVCDRWRPSFGGHSMLQDAAIGFRRRVGERAARTSPPRQSQGSHEKVVMLYKSCLTESAEGIDEFKRFLREHRMPWPKVDTRASIVQVAVDLSVNWHYPLFFYVYVLFSTPGPTVSPSTKHLPARVVFTDAFLGLGPRLLLKERQLRKNNAEHICQLRDALRERGDEESKSVSCERLDGLQREVLGDSTATSGNESLENESWTLYDNMDSFADDLTPSVSGHHWLRLLSRNQSDLVGSDAVPRVAVYNKIHMRKLGSLFGSKRWQTDLLRVAGLCMVQGLGRFASNQLATLIYGDGVARARRHPDLCYGLVDQMVPRLLSARYIALLLDIERVAKATEVFHAVKSAVGESVRRAAWLKDSAHLEAFARISRSVLTFEAVLTGEAAGAEVPSLAATANLPEFGDDFIGNLRRIPRVFWDGVHRDLMATPSSFGFAPGNRLQSMHAPEQTTLWWADVWHQHDASLFALSPHDVIIPNLYMLESVFPYAAYESVNYGLVGSLLARQLLAISFRAAGTDGSYKSRLDQLATNDSVRCVQEAFQRGELNVTELEEDPRNTEAMLVAVASLKPLLESLSTSPGYPEWSRGFDDYSAEQLFFLALCFPSCGLPGDKMASRRGGPGRASWCNVPLMLFDAFGEAFHCQPGRTMNPRSKCAAW